ncbi:MAG: hypothetical protein HOD92_07955 [Deltaproteobacteria bacterium]|nr:hypothetical protein [Deltaproteobacteria bacterium]
MQNINQLLIGADNLRFKLLAIIGKSKERKENIIEYLDKEGWTEVDVENELLQIRKDLEKNNEDIDTQIGTRIKEWFSTKPNNLILTNASILYHELFTKISPIGAFKYNSRNKNCVIFLEHEKLFGSRISYGTIGKEDRYDQEINDILKVNIDEISDDFTPTKKKRELIIDKSKLGPDAIGRLFDFEQIKDVVDIDADLKSEDSQKAIVESYVISESLENQIFEFFINLEKKGHKANTVIGNYGSGKSHLVALLVSLVDNPDLAIHLKNEKIKEVVQKQNRKFLTVQFELQAGTTPLKKWFFDKIRFQLNEKYSIEIPKFDPKEEYDDKLNIDRILDIIKDKYKDAGLVVVIDEISDFLLAKQIQGMRADLQFLRIIGQVCQDSDLMFVGSMQEDVFTSPKFKNVAAELGRVEERFQNIIIHKEDIKRVISNRIVPKSKEQRLLIEQKLKEFAEKIDDVGRNIDEYVDLYPLTPFLLEMFSDLPYFEKRGVIQFAMNEIKYILNEGFPYFITFDKIYDQLEGDQNKKNLEEVYNIIKVLEVLTQKISLLDPKFQDDANKVVKALAVYSIWNRKEKGATAKELANNLMVLPQNKMFKVEDNISLIIKKIREVADGQYIKAVRDEQSNIEYFKFDKTIGPDIEVEIEQKTASVSDDEIEYELFFQLEKLLELLPAEGPDIFKDECQWTSVKSFRRGYILFKRHASEIGELPPNDYAIVLASPFVKEVKESLAKNQLNIRINLPDDAHVQQLKEIVAIKNLSGSKFSKVLINKKLEERINGYQKGATQVTGLKFRLAKLLFNQSECTLNGKPESIKSRLGREYSTAPEIIDAFKTAVFDTVFNIDYPLHPIYSIQLSSTNIVSSLSPIATDLSKGNFTDLFVNTKRFLQSLELLDESEFPDTSQSKIAVDIIQVINKNIDKVTDIEKEIVQRLRKSEYGLEPAIVNLILVLLTVQGKVFLQAKGGDRIDINNIKDKLKSLAAFETIAYVKPSEGFDPAFAERLMNSLGLNGAKIKIVKEQPHAFKEYKEKIHDIRNEILTIKGTLESLGNYSTIHIPLESAQEQLDSIEEIGWEQLDIANYTQFSKIESVFAPKLANIKISLANLKNLQECITEYRSNIHDGIDYMMDALEVLENNKILINDSKKHNALKTILKDTSSITSDFAKFSDKSQRNPLIGKIKQFKKSYVADFYYPTHEKMVGGKADWSQLNTYQQQSSFKKLKVLSRLTCISEVKLNQLIIQWNKLLKHQCSHKDLLNNLDKNIRCQKCFFPQDENYSKILSIVTSIDETIESLFIGYQETVIKEIREYKDNVQFLDSEEEKITVNTIIEKQELPTTIDSVLITTINKLFKEIEIEEVESDDVINALFPTGQMITIEELDKAYFGWKSNLVKGKTESEVRLKLK